MGRRDVVKRRDRPLPLGEDAVVGDRNRGRNGNRAVGRFVEDRAVRPYDLAVMGFVVLDLDIVVVMVEPVGREVAVRNGVAVRVAVGLMDVLWRQGRRQRQKRRDEKQRGGPGRRTSHSVHY